MARSDRDIDHKADALRFCVVSGAIPYLEVQIASAVDLTSDEKVLTDIDVLGLRLGPDGSTHRLLFDCKSSKIPPMSRAFWLAGLMAYVRGDEGFVILGRSAEKAHRLSAQAINVRLFDKEGFGVYAAATDPEFPLVSSYGADTEAWHRLAEGINTAGSMYQGLWRQLSSEVPLAREAPKRFRRILSVVREHRGELDPVKPLHMALFTEAVLASSVLLATMVGELRNLIELTEEQDGFTSTLRYYLWGGRDGYATLQRINELSGRAEISEFETSIVAWPQFVQLTRSLLEAPPSVRNCCMPLRELALRFVADAAEESDIRVGKLFARPRARQFTHRIAAYLATAAKLPNDFPKRLGEEVDRLVGVAERSAAVE